MSGSKDDQEGSEAKKQRLEPEASGPTRGPEPRDFPQVVAAMFPDVDHAFLVRECQHLQTSDDLGRFINTVMLTELYAKKGTLNDSPVPVTDFAQPTPPIVAARATPSCSTEAEGAEGQQEGARRQTEEEWVETQAASLETIFPQSDPTFIRSELSRMKMSPDAMNTFVLSKLERNDMPTREEYERRVEMTRLQNLYTDNFSIEEFLAAIPDPWTYFEGSTRLCSKYRGHSLCYLKDMFRHQTVKLIDNTLSGCNDNLFATYKNLVTLNQYYTRTTRRSNWECDYNRPTSVDIQFLQEVAFINHEANIKAYLAEKEMKRTMLLEEARASGQLVECQCCYDSEILAQDIITCPNDHKFCRDCVVRLVEVEMGNGRSTIECMSTCTAAFPLSTLQAALRPELFSKLLHAVQQEEIQAAGLEGLAQCPFCNYATILPATERVLKCLNPECLKESCVLCKETSHIPLRCEEVEKSEEMRLRTWIESKMTEALVRECYKCKKKFVKEDGCNKMTCTCGAKMCYICRQPVQDYKHFNGQGGQEYDKCPLYSTNDELHVDPVMRAAEAAKREALQTHPAVTLRHDPTLVAPPRTDDAPLPGARR